MRSCEQLLFSTMAGGHQPLSDEERQMVEYYVDELKTRLVAPQSRCFGMDS
jgi:hypothetical protein